MSKKNYLNPIIKFLKKFGKVNTRELLKQINHDLLYVKVDNFSFCFKWENGWKLLGISQEQV